jgi:hypothetical protein
VLRDAGADTATGLEERKSWMAGTRPAMTIVGFTAAGANDSIGLTNGEINIANDGEMFPC